MQQETLQNHKVIILITRQLNEIQKKSPEGVRIIRNEADVLDIQADINGPDKTPYQGGVFRCRLYIPGDFPKSPPKGFFTTKIFHPNVSEKGEICVNTLKKDWDPKRWSIYNILEVIKCLLIAPFPESALNEEAGKLLMEDYDQYFNHARILTEIYAQPKNDNEQEGPQQQQQIKQGDGQRQQQQQQQQNIVQQLSSGIANNSLNQQKPVNNNNNTLINCTNNSVNNPLSPQKENDNKMVEEHMSFQFQNSNNGVGQQNINSNNSNVQNGSSGNSMYTLHYKTPTKDNLLLENNQDLTGSQIQCDNPLQNNNNSNNFNIIQSSNSVWQNGSLNKKQRNIQFNLQFTTNFSLPVNKINSQQTINCNNNQQLQQNPMLVKKESDKKKWLKRI